MILLPSLSIPPSAKPCTLSAQTRSPKLCCSQPTPHSDISQAKFLQTQLQRVFAGKIKNENITLQRVEGLNIYDSAKFNDTGFHNLVEITSKEIRSAKAAKEKVILNISGGYKAILPVMTLVAQLEEVPLNYVYEDSNEIIEIGNLPISFDWAAIEALKPFAW